MHIIRLRGPWQIVALEAESDETTTAAVTAVVPGDWAAALGADYHGRARLTRRFGSPTNLAPEEKVFLVVGAADCQAKVVLNGELLGEQDSSTGECRYDITRLLRPRNELRITLASRPDQPGKIGEVRLEIDDA